MAAALYSLAYLLAFPAAGGLLMAVGKLTGRIERRP